MGSLAICAIHFLVPFAPVRFSSRFLARWGTATHSTAIQVFKQRFSRRFRCNRRASAGQLNLTFANGEVSLPRFWTGRFHDFSVWSLRKRFEKLHCMHRNPLKRKSVNFPQDGPWSSFSFYSKRSPIGVSLGGTSNQEKWPCGSTLKPA